jgi:hypothetical protein
VGQQVDRNAIQANGFNMLSSCRTQAKGGTRVPPSASGRSGEGPAGSYFAMQVSAVSGVQTSRPV